MTHPENEPILEYGPGSPERETLQEELSRQSSEVVEIPCIINGELVFTGDTTTQVMPHDHGHVLATVHLAGEAEVRAACEAAVAAQESWIAMGLEARSQIFLRAADVFQLLRGGRVVNVAICVSGDEGEFVLRRLFDVEANLHG